MLEAFVRLQWPKERIGNFESPTVIYLNGKLMNDSLSEGLKSEGEWPIGQLEVTR